MHSQTVWNRQFLFNTATCWGFSAFIHSLYKSIAIPFSWSLFQTSAIWCPAALSSDALAQGIPTLSHIAFIVFAWSLCHSHTIIFHNHCDFISSNADVIDGIVIWSNHTFLPLSVVLTILQDGCTFDQIPLPPPQGADTNDWVVVSNKLLSHIFIYLSLASAPLYLFGFLLITVVIACCGLTQLSNREV